MMLLTSAQELQQMMRAGEKPLIIDARRRIEYNTGHILGASIMRWEQFCESPPAGTSSTLHQPGWWGRLANLEKNEFKALLKSVGVSKHRRTIVYADGARTKGRDGRIAWMLLYLGLEQVSMLNGGWRAWRSIDGEVNTDGISAESTPEDFIAKDFEVDIDHSRRITHKDIRAKNDFFCVDTRTRDEYTGELYDYQPRKGRIPGSINIPFSSLYDANEKFISNERFREMVTLLSGERDLDFSYCEVGVRAATFSLLYEFYFEKILPVYDGSFMEWSFDDTLSVQKG